MVKKASTKDFFREIKNTFSRFVSITLLLLVGVSFYVGLRSTSPDMLYTIDKYYDEYNMYDIEVISTIGLEQADLDVIREIDGVSNVESTINFELLSKKDNQEMVSRVYTLTDSVNQLELISGRMPEAENECVLVTVFNLFEYSLGEEIEISGTG